MQGLHLNLSGAQNHIQTDMSIRRVAQSRIFLGFMYSSPLLSSTPHIGNYRLDPIRHHPPDPKLTMDRRELAFFRRALQIGHGSSSWSQGSLLLAYVSGNLFP